MSTSKVIKPRPYWHVDAKWLTGIFLLLLLNITFLIFLLVQVTGPEQGITLLTTTLASSFSFESGGLDTSSDLEIMRQKIAESPDGQWQPIPGLQIIVREEDIAGKTPREARLWFFRQMAEPLYYNGEQGLADIMTDPEMKKGLAGGVGPLGLISAATHRKLLVVFAVSGLVSLLFLGLLVFFSHRFGRLGSPGCVIFLVAVPNLILMGGLRGWLANAAQTPASTGAQALLSRYLQLAADVLPGIVQKAMYVYIFLVFLGIALLLVALIGSVFVRERKNKD
ncbi:MAG: hypothetical protein A2X25_07290 [Chloroflexi bacterium GWB2_49_20]|nr:MAG: hypothetical protein A2X25_07290 [Chloroflexi bacterium GWB2_49_20]OGN77961.1 MAG: hypothetical protein A2X26_15095 [Chloroflexi bacterium GWC2_49_37]OGN84999.1 MAG: hypothetical protein A2X27_09795 [Chloroflexi bacterium GWD2_49_16]HBG74970.1 hypothetical protein [Anaerolineae bacterium]HCC78306.1 hypothetical protein [Anaerolineae bacterium]